MYQKPCEHGTCKYFYQTLLGKHDERMTPIDSGGKSSKVKVTMDNCGNYIVNNIYIKLLNTF